MLQTSFLKTKKGHTFVQPFFKTNPGTNPLWVSDEVFIITSGVPKGMDRYVPNIEDISLFPNHLFVNIRKSVCKHNMLG